MALDFKFQESQRQFAAHLRDPKTTRAPDDVEDRRMAIYRDLIYSNIENFICSGFPILREIHNDAQWQILVREFIIHHQCHTPYFLEISQEFLSFLQQRQVPEEQPFLVELAHYEWVELALDVSPEKFPDDVFDGDLLAQYPVVSPLAWNLSYQFPVHQICKSLQPDKPPELPTFLVVYRNRDDRVGFMESNAATSRLLTLLEGDSKLTGRQALVLLAEEMAAPDTEAIIQFGRDVLTKMQSLGIICGCR